MLVVRQEDLLVRHLAEGLLALYRDDLLKDLEALSAVEAGLPRCREVGAERSE